MSFTTFCVEMTPEVGAILLVNLALNGVLRQIPELEKGKPLAVETVLLDSFFTVIEVNRHRCISVATFMSLSVAKTSGADACLIGFSCILTVRK